MIIKKLDKLFLVFFGHVKWLKSIFKGFWYSDLKFIVIVDIATVMCINVLTILKCFNVSLRENQILPLIVFACCLLLTWSYYHNQQNRILNDYYNGNIIISSSNKWAVFGYVLMSFVSFIALD